MTISVSTLFTALSSANILATGLELAEAIGLPVTSWRVGDPTRTLFQFVASILGSRESTTSEFVRSAFLSTASGDWLTVVASELYGVDREEATYATSTITLTNSGGGYYPIGVGDLTVKSSVNGKTYHNTSELTLTASSSGDVDVVCDEAGSAGSAGANEINTMITSYIGVTVTASTAAVGVDEQSDSSLKEQCESTTGALSPNGPPDAYEYVVRNSELTGSTEVTRAASTEDADDLTVTVYVAGASGAVSGAAVTAAQTAVEAWATPLCVTPTVVSASNLALALTATVSGDDVPATAEADVTSAFGALLAYLPPSTTGADVVISHASLVSLIYQTLVAGGASNLSVTVSSPAGDTTPAIGQVATAGAVSVTEV